MVVTRRGRALVDVVCAVLPAEACRARANVVVEADDCGRVRVRAGAAVLTWRAAALVDVVIAVFARPACNTMACVRVDFVFALRSVLALVRCTLVDVHIAKNPGPSRRAGASESLESIVTHSSVLASVIDPPIATDDKLALGLILCLRHLGSSVQIETEAGYERRPGEVREFDQAALVGREANQLARFCCAVQGD